MYKLVGEEKFLLWVVCSIQLQVFCGNGGEKLLVLAEGLLKKHVASHSLHEPEALMVYISILEQQAKYGDALELLSGKLGLLLTVEVDNLTIKGRLFARLGDYAAAANVFQRMLELCPDEWDCIVCWRMKVSGVVCQKMNKLIYQNFCPARFHICPMMWGPYLANIEIERRKQLHGKRDDSKMMEALTKYYVRFGHLASFTADIEMFLEVLTSKKKKLKTLLYKWWICMVKTFHFQRIWIHKKICTVKSFYQWHAMRWFRNFGYFIEAIMVLEFGSTIRRHVSQYKILLLHLYSHLGVLSLAHEQFKSPDVNNILMKTLSCLRYWFLPFGWI